VPDFRPDECDWFDACENTAHGMAAHPDKGVIPVCEAHVAAFGIHLITLIEKDN
jgi:hypothetical protein